MKLHTAANLAKQSAESEALLGGCLHLYQIHRRAAAAENLQPLA